MRTSKFIKNELNSVASLNQLISSLEELSAMRYRKTKNNVLTTRSYLDEINFLYKQVKNNYKRVKESSGEKFVETKFRKAKLRI